MYLTQHYTKYAIYGGWFKSLSDAVTYAALFGYRYKVTIDEV